MEGNLSSSSPLASTPLSLNPLPRPCTSLLHPLSLPSYDSFGSDLLDDPFSPPPSAHLLADLPSTPTRTVPLSVYLFSFFTLASSLRVSADLPIRRVTALCRSWLHPLVARCSINFHRNSQWLAEEYIFGSS